MIYQQSSRSHCLPYTDVIEHNPANYTAWHFRRELLVELNKDLKEEMIYCTQMADANLKNYQVC